MIARIWTGRARTADADTYGDFLHRTAYTDYGAAEGNRGWVLLRRESGEDVEFAFLSLWESMAAVQGYAGDDASRPKHYAEDDRFLIERSESVGNYVVVGKDGLA